MIGQYLSNTNKIVTVLILPKILELNKTIAIAKRVRNVVTWWRSCFSGGLQFISREIIMHAITHGNVDARLPARFGR